jgi:hypothetical protein
MSKKIGITLDDEVLDFVDGRANNRSSFINRVLREEKRRILMQELADAYQDRVGLKPLLGPQGLFSAG